MGTKADRITFAKGLPGRKEGDNGDISVRTVKGQGTHLCIKAKGSWYFTPLVTEFKPIDDFTRTLLTRIPRYDGELGYNSTTFVIDAIGDLAVGKGNAVAVIESRGDNDLKLQTGNTTTGTIVITDGNNGNITVDPAGTGDLVLSSGFIKIPEPTSKASDSTKVLAWDTATETIRYRDAIEVGLAFDGSTANGVCTYKDSDEISVESELTYDSGVLSVSHLTAQLKLAKDANDYATFTIADTGDLTIATVGDGTRDSDLTLDADGTIYLKSAGRGIGIDANVQLQFNGLGGNTNIVGGIADELKINVGGDEMLHIDETVDTGVTTLQGTLKVKEQSAASADTAGEGQLWIKDEDPCELYFTNDDGDDIQITDGTAIAGGGTDTWSKSVGGYKLNNNSATFWYTQSYPNYHSWTLLDSSPTTVAYSWPARAVVWVADKDGSLTNMRVQLNAADTGLTDPVKFYVYKGTTADESATTSLTLIGTSSAITPVAARSMVQSDDFSSSNTFSEGDGLYVLYKKDSTSGNQDLYFSVTISGEYD